MKKVTSLSLNFVFYRYLYWTDMGQTAKIERSLLDGSNRTVLVQSGISLPRAIAIDFATHDVYWIDSVVDAIQVRPIGCCS